MLKPAVEYILTFSYTTKEELENAQTKATRSFLQAMGYNPNFPRTVAYATKEIGGIGMNRLYSDQGIKSVFQMMKHIMARTLVGELFMMAMDWALCGKESKNAYWKILKQKYWKLQQKS